MIFDLFITFSLIFLNGFFVAVEFAIVKVRASQLEIKVKAGNRFAIQAKHIISHIDAYLAATQLGITLASLALGWIGEPVVAKLIIHFMNWLSIPVFPEIAHDIALPVAFVCIAILHIVFGELAPKSVAIQRSERIALLTAYPIQFFYILFRPFIWLLNGLANFILKMMGVSVVQNSEVHSSGELRYLIQKGKETGAIDDTEYTIIKNAFNFSDQTVKQVMVPRIKVVAIDLNDFNETLLNKVIEEGYSRIPCYEDNMDKVAGVVYLKDVLIQLRKKESINIREIMHSVIIVPETKHIGPMLKEFQLKHQQIAIVTDEYGGTKGVVTMEDILEELVGEIQDEYDAETPVVEKANERTYSVLASASLDDINNLLPRPIEKMEQYDTLAGYLIFKFGRIPNINEKVEFCGYEFQVLKKDKNAIVLVQVRDLND